LSIDGGDQPSGLRGAVRITATAEPRPASSNVGLPPPPAEITLLRAEIDDLRARVRDLANLLDRVQRGVIETHALLDDPDGLAKRERMLREIAAQPGNK
jgi:hypothetical protein